MSITYLDINLFNLICSKKKQVVSTPPMLEGYYVENLDTGAKQEFEDTQAMKDWVESNKTSALMTGNVKIVNNPNTITDMSTMFWSCSSLTSLDLSSFDTSSVNDMSTMFWSCSSLTSLDLSSFDTSSVNDMYSMFSYCSSLTSLDLSSFDTSSVNDMASMFSYCNKMEDINLLSFDTSSVTRMSGMFKVSYTSTGNYNQLDLSSFDTSSVSDMNEMFDYIRGVDNCYGRTQADCNRYNNINRTALNFTVKPV